MHHIRIVCHITFHLILSHDGIGGGGIRERILNSNSLIRVLLFSFGWVRLLLNAFWMLQIYKLPSIGDQEGCTSSTTSQHWSFYILIIFHWFHTSFLSSLKEALCWKIIRFWLDGSKQMKRKFLNQWLWRFEARSNNSTIVSKVCREIWRSFRPRNLIDESCF